PPRPHSCPTRRSSDLAHRARDLERLARDVGGVAVLPLQHARLRDKPEQCRALRTWVVAEVREATPGCGKGLVGVVQVALRARKPDRKSTRLNSSHSQI